MAIRPNRYYNDPNIGMAFSNLAAMFGPPSGSDAAGWANAQATRQQADNLQFLFDNPMDEHFDRRNIATGNYNPMQSFEALRTHDATNRRGQDVQAATARRGQDVGFASDMHRPLNPGQVRPGFDGEIAEILGLPAIPEAHGLPAPLTTDQWQAGEAQRLQQSGALTDDMLLAEIMGSTPIEQVVGEGGQPVYGYRHNAVGQEAFVNPGSQARPANAMGVLPDGTQVPAIQTSDGRWAHAQTGDVLPENVRIFSTPSPTGTAEEVGVTNRTLGDVESRLMSIDSTVATATRLRDLIASSPSSQGIVGATRNTLQNIVQTGGELGRFLGQFESNVLAEVNEAVRNGLIESELASDLYDPNIPAIEMLTNLLAWQYAKSMAGDRVSNEQLRQAAAHIGGQGLLANQADSTARLNTLIGELESERSRLSPYAPGIRQPEGQQGPATVNSEQEYNALPSGALFTAPDGTVRRKP